MSTATLADIARYMGDSARGAVGTRLAAQPGSSVARVEIAITAAGVAGTPLKPYQLIPAAFVIHAISHAAGAGTDNAKLAVEARVTDSVSGQILARIVREAKGIELPSNQALTLEMLKPAIDEWAAAAAKEITAQLRNGQ